MKIDQIRLSFIFILLLAIMGISKEKAIYSVAGDVKPPKAISTPRAPYTEEARRNGIEGTVLMEAVITAEGTVSDVRIIRSLGHGLDESALHTLQSRWVFEPATYQGEPVAVKMNFEMNFSRLDKTLPAKESVAVDRLKFEGNRLFTEDQLRSTLREKLGTAPVMDRSDIERAIREVYQAQGYVQVNTRWLPNNVLCTQEGRRFYLGKFEIVGVTAFSMDTLLALLELRVGEPLDISKIQTGLDRIQRLYPSAGLPLSSYSVEQSSGRDEAEINITLRLKESK